MLFQLKIIKVFFLLALVLVSDSLLAAGVDFFKSPRGESQLHLGVVFDCYQRDAKPQADYAACIQLHTLRLGFQERLHEHAKASFSLSPWAPLNQRYSRRMLGSLDVPRISDTSLYIFDDLLLTWEARPGLFWEVGVEPGVLYFPQQSRLAPAGLFADSGWKQLALRMRYELPWLEGVNFRLAIGRGEGQLLEELGAQKYVGLGLGLRWAGWNFWLGYSEDPSFGSTPVFEWQERQLRTDCDFTSWNPIGGSKLRRLGFGVELDGQKIPGLRFGVGWQRLLQVDRRDSVDFLPLDKLETCKRWDPDTLFVEDPENKMANEMERMVGGINFSYEILSKFFIGFDYEERHLRSWLPFVRSCQEYQGLSCVSPGDPGKRLVEQAYAFGGGMRLAPGFELALTYHRRQFMKKYEKFYYLRNSNKAQTFQDTYNARLTYKWQ